MKKNKWQHKIYLLKIIQYFISFCNFPLQGSSLHTVDLWYFLIQRHLFFYTPWPIHITFISTTSFVNVERSALNICFTWGVPNIYIVSSYFQHYFPSQFVHPNIYLLNCPCLLNVFESLVRCCKTQFCTCNSSYYFHCALPSICRYYMF